MTTSAPFTSMSSSMSAYLAQETIGLSNTISPTIQLEPSDATMGREGHQRRMVPVLLPSSISRSSPRAAYFGQETIELSDAAPQTIHLGHSLSLPDAMAEREGHQRREAPVLVSPRRKQEPLKSTSVHLRFRISERRQPVSAISRMAAIASTGRGFIYYISREGVTGEQNVLSETIASQVAGLRECTTLPIAVGFGISTPAQATTVARHADGVVVGSAIVRQIAENAKAADLAQRVHDFVRPLVRAAKSA